MVPGEEVAEQDRFVCLRVVADLFLQRQHAARGIELGAGGHGIGAAGPVAAPPRFGMKDGVVGNVARRHHLPDFFDPMQHLRRQRDAVLHQFFVIFRTDWPCATRHCGPDTWSDLLD